MVSKAPGSSTPPPANVPTPTLPAQINAATQKQHVVLNRLIIERLPLALPPQASSLLPYGLGIAAFAQIFFAFEEAWDAAAKEPGEIDGCHDAHVSEVRHWLADLRPAGLARSARLGFDLDHISAVTGVRIRDKVPQADEERRLFQESVRKSPHILIAYSWVMYMAIFSGGRWIRQQLLNAGEDFWAARPGYILSEKADDTIRKGVSGMSFLWFDGEQDGEDIKSLYKARLTEAEERLTEEERVEVVAAAVRLFDECIGKVLMLDEAVKRQTTRQNRRRMLPFAVLLMLIVTVGCYFMLMRPELKSPVFK